MSAWRLDQLRKHFPGGWLGGPGRTAVDGVSLDILAGERVALVGESGSGKTTLALTGLGLISADGGAITLHDEDTSDWSAGRWQQARSKSQMLFQDPRAMLNPSMPIGLLLEESAAIHQPSVEPIAAAQHALEQVGLADRGGAHIHQLSGGEVRRAGVARLLLAQPALVIADEPTAGLDAALKADLIELLLRQVGPECAVVLISHDLPMVLWACDRVLVMKDGLLVDRFEVDGLDSASRHPYTQQLLQAAGVAA